MTEFPRLTQFSRASGCGCKIAPADLEIILKEIRTEAQVFPGLILGPGSADDAAVWDLGNGMVLVATTDFFLPAVDHPEHFGRIAAANALSDVYAMGARPIFALALLGWPLDKLGAEAAIAVLDGAKTVCHSAGIPIAGGHSVETSEPLFGLSVVGSCQKVYVKTNGGARPGDVLYLTKPLGSGVLMSAFRRNLIQTNDPVYLQLLDYTTKLNSLGQKLGEFSYVNALTDVTGFGLLGHLLEMCRASGVSATLYWQKVPVMSEAKRFVSQLVYPDITFRNWNYVKDYVFAESEMSAEKILMLCDPQTNGGLLISVDAHYVNDFEDFLDCAGETYWTIGEMKPPQSSFSVFIR